MRIQVTPAPAASRVATGCCRAAQAEVLATAILDRLLHKAHVLNTRPSGTSVRYSSNWLEKLRSVSTEPTAAQHKPAKDTP